MPSFISSPLFSSAGLEADAEVAPDSAWDVGLAGSWACFAPAGLVAVVGVSPGLAWEFGVSGPCACFALAALGADAGVSPGFARSCLLLAALFLCWLFVWLRLFPQPVGLH